MQTDTEKLSLVDRKQDAPQNERVSEIRMTPNSVNAKHSVRNDLTCWFDYLTETIPKSQVFELWLSTEMIILSQFYSSY